MPPIEQFHFFADFFSWIEAGMKTYMTGATQNVTAMLATTVRNLLILYVISWGWLLWRGVIQEPFMDGLVRTIKISVIIGVALNLGLYNTLVLDTLWNSPSALAKVIAPDRLPGEGTLAFLDTIFSQFFAVGMKFWDHGAAAGYIIPDIVVQGLAVLIWIAGGALTTVGAAFAILAFVTLSVMLGFGQIFILALMSSVTRDMFGRWLGEVLTSLWQVVLVAAVLTLIGVGMTSYLDKTLAAGALAHPSNQQALAAMCMCGIGILFFLQIPSKASALGGGIATGTLGVFTAAWRAAKGVTGSGFDLARGKTLSDARANRRARESNARWASANPGVTARIAGAPMALYRHATGAGVNSVKRA